MNKNLNGQKPGFAERLIGLSRHIDFSRTFSALRYPNYRLWFWSQMVSLFGSWMQGTALGFLVYELTKSSAYLGLVGFASGAPTWLFMLYAGVVADRFPRRKLIIITQTTMMLLAFILAGLAFLKMVKPWEILVLAFGLGTANAFEAPARLAFVLEMVEPEYLTNAIALNAAMFNTATAVGPAVGGIIYAIFGPAWCFTINGLSFIAVIIALSRMNLEPWVSKPRVNSTLQDLKEGIRYVIHHRMIRILIATVGVVTLFGFSFATLVPAWAVEVLKGDAKTNGFLQSARGIGALLGALLIASLGRFKFKGKVLTLGSFAFPSLLLVFAFVRWTPLSLLFLLGAGAALIFIFNICNSLVQTLAPNDLRGRVMGIYSFTFFGLLPLGSLWIGAVAEKIGDPAAVIVGASITLIYAAAVYFFVPRLRRQT